MTDSVSQKSDEYSRERFKLLSKSSGDQIGAERKHYMAVEFEPSKRYTGDAWYVEGNLCMATLGHVPPSISSFWF